MTGIPGGQAGFGRQVFTAQLSLRFEVLPFPRDLAANGRQVRKLAANLEAK
jgi:hypothetical protein